MINIKSPRQDIIDEINNTKFTGKAISHEDFIKRLNHHKYHLDYFDFKSEVATALFFSDKAINYLFKRNPDGEIFLIGEAFVPDSSTSPSTGLSYMKIVRS